MRYNVAVIGGGPAGMMAAGMAAQNGAKVILIEKNDQLGQKLLLTGKRRCNFTNAEPDRLKFMERYGKNGKFFFSAFNSFNNNDVINFFEQRGLKTKIEENNKVFPASDQGQDVLSALISFLKENKVEILLKTEVEEIQANAKAQNLESKGAKKEQGANEEVAQVGAIIEKIRLKDGREIEAENYIIATGGMSFPVTGSTGDGYKWAKEVGQTVIEPKPALTPILIKEKWITDLQGVSLENVRINVFQNNKKQDERTGEALFTQDGMSGPIIIDLSKKIAELLTQGEVFIKIDFEPKLSYPALDQKLQNFFQENKKKELINGLDSFLPKKLAKKLVDLLEINPQRRLNDIHKNERKKMGHLFKELTLQVKGVGGFNKAIITSGGVALNEVDPKTMRSKIVKNLYFAGEVLNLDGPTGGFNLQIAWSTGYAAGSSF